METIVLKAPAGTKARLKRIQQKQGGSAYDKVKHLCGIFKGASRNLSTSKDYLKQYAPKKHR